MPLDQTFAPFEVGTNAGKVLLCFLPGLRFFRPQGLANDDDEQSDADGSDLDECDCPHGQHRIGDAEGPGNAKPGKTGPCKHQHPSA